MGTGWKGKRGWGWDREWWLLLLRWSKRERARVEVGVVEGTATEGRKRKNRRNAAGFRNLWVAVVVGVLLPVARRGSALPVAVVEAVAAGGGRGRGRGVVVMRRMRCKAWFGLRFPACSPAIDR